MIRIYLGTEGDSDVVHVMVYRDGRIWASEDAPTLALALRRARRSSARRRRRRKALWLLSRTE